MRRSFGLLAVAGGLLGVGALLARTLRTVSTAPVGSTSDQALATGWMVACLVVATALVAWLLAATTFQLLAELFPAARRLRRAADHLAPAVLRATGRGVVGVTTSLSLTLALPAQVPSAPIEAPVSEHVERATLVPVPDDAVEDTAVPTASLVPIPSVVEAQPTATPVVAPPIDELTVRPGDSFWRLADGIVSEALGRAATDAEVAPYWVRLVDANRDRLVVTGEPDLIYAGQVFRRPPVDAGAAGGRSSLPMTG